MLPSLRRLIISRFIVEASSCVLSMMATALHDGQRLLFELKRNL